MELDATKLAGAAILAAFLSAVGPAQAQDTRWQPFVSITPVYEGKGDLDNGGDFSAWHALVRGGVTGELSPGVGAGVTLNYDYSDYSFSNPVAFGGVAPWNIVQRYGVAIPLSFALRDGWSVGFIPSVDWFKENGAKTGDSLVWGGIVSGTKRFADGNRLGLGVGVLRPHREDGRVPLPDRRLALQRPLAPHQPARRRPDRAGRRRARLPVRQQLGARRRRGVAHHALSPQRERAGAERSRRRARGAGIPARHPQSGHANVAPPLRRGRRGRRVAGRRSFRQHPAQGRLRPRAVRRCDVRRSLLNA